MSARALAVPALVLALVTEARAICPEGEPADTECASPTGDYDLDLVLDAIECYWCSQYDIGDPLYMDPVDGNKDTDEDGTLDNVDAFPGDVGYSGTMNWTGASCADPAAVLILDPEFSERSQQVMWIDDSGTTKLKVATVNSSGNFVSPAVVDESNDILFGPANLKNGPEWVYDDGDDKMGIVYSKLVDSTATVHVAWFDSSWNPVSLGVTGRSAFGTVADTSLTGGAVMYVKGSDLVGYDHYFCHLSDCDGTETEAWPLNLTPPDLMRFAEVDDVPPALVGVDYTGSTPYPVFEWTESAPGGTDLVTGGQSKYKGWKWYSPLADEVLVLTSDQVFASPDTGPGLIRIYDTATPANLWQIIPVGRNDFPYIGSIEPFVDHNGTSWIVFAASKGKYPSDNLATRVVMAEVSASAVGDVAPTLTIRQVDDAVDDGTKKWKDPEGHTDGTTSSWVYMTGWNTDLQPEDGYDTLRCVTGI